MAVGHDVVVVGGAATGAATAYHLRRLAPELSVAVVERDLHHEHCSTLRSDGNLRVQFNLAENIAMSQYTFGLLATFARDMAVGDWRPDLAPKHQGNLFLTDEAARAAAMEGLELQQSMGCDVHWLDADEIDRRWPQLRLGEGDRDGDDAVVGGTHGPGDGAIDPTALLHGFRRRSDELGATWLEGEVAAIRTDGGRVTGVRLAGGEVLPADAVVLAAGAWSAPLAATAGIDLPVEPVMRTVHVVQHPAELDDVPSVFLPSGLYALPEGGGTSQVAWSTDADPVGFDFTYRRAGFEEVVWPELVRVLPGYDRLRSAGGWCGLYASNTLDHNALLGAWPGLDGAWIACGFSGHGFQHTPAMGRHLAESIAGLPTSLDLGRLAPGRVLDGTPVREHAGRII